jgi:hypothetical protein
MIAATLDRAEQRKRKGGKKGEEVPTGGPRERATHRKRK